MKNSIIACLTFILFLPSVALTEDLQVLDDYVPEHWDYLKSKGNKLQEYEDYIPQYGDYYEWDGRKWQRYKKYIPQYGDYLEKIKRKEKERKRPKTEWVNHICETVEKVYL